MMDYKEILYRSYRSTFKGDSCRASLEFGAAKLRPVVEPWCRRLPKDACIIDLGCGAGELLMVFEKLGFTNLAGCDLSQEQTDISRRHFPGVQTLDCFAFLEQLPNASVDLITAFDLIEHLGPQSSFDLMDLIRQKLRPGGRIIVHLPNGISPFVGAVFWGDMTHQWCLTPQSARTFCLANGFTDYECVEHLGNSQGLKGTVRKLGWAVLRSLMKCVNQIETGHDGGEVWTRNFAFTATKSIVL